ncbi:MAG: type I DNA topoisomerase [Verrucomicrobia bacterium]|nr:type I DNA topoisomerase [Verrucomicrobiota bacterium]
MAKSAKSLIIVESPAKIKTLQKLLGPTYLFESSYGHVRDLPEKEFGIDIEKNFEPNYVLLPKKKDVIAKLKKSAKECEIIYLATDPDREGEAIAWHISQILPATSQIKRISFNSITRDAVQEAVRNPTELNDALINAQQSRRLLDRLVGYTISPLLNRRLKRGRGQSVSAGRVQSAALKLVVDREKEIEAFIPQEYWTLSAKLQSQTSEKPFTAYLYSIDKKRVEKERQPNKVEGEDYVLVNTEEIAKSIAGELERAEFRVKNIEKKEKKRNPEAPFITSTMQQEASRHFRFAPAKTMEIAQSLYEGVDLGSEGAEGLITYMRTDSVRIAPEAINEARDYILKEFGPQFLPETPRKFQSKKSAQDAHEAIRPTNLHHHPDKIRDYLTKEQYNLYTLVWKRFLASQMNPAIYDTVSVDIQAADRYMLRATGSQIKFQGFLVLYEEKHDEEQENDEHALLPPLTIEELLKLLHLDYAQSFTRPPPRFTEASLVKELEKSGIGRPSTYATIMKKIQSRDYTTKEQNRLKPTELGRLICEVLEVNFTQIMDIRFTAHMEDDLEEVAEDKKNWITVLKDFWAEFSPTLETAENSVIIPKIATDIPCPKCGGLLQKVWSKTKYFLGCEHYPECDYTSSLEEVTFDKNDYEPDFDWEQRCPKCGEEMKLRFGKFGPFLGCTKYPDCKGIVSIPKKGESAQSLLTEKVSCPAIGCEGHLVQRRSRFGKPFLSCSEYPACDVIGNDVETVLAKYENHPKTPYVKKATARKGKAAATKKTTTKKTKTTKAKSTKTKK